MMADTSDHETRSDSHFLRVRIFCSLRGFTALALWEGNEGGEFVFGPPDRGD